jgi:hypothetical protein
MNRAAKVGIIMGIMFGVIIGYMYQYNKLALEVDSLKGYIRKLEQSQQTEVTDSTTKGKYTMITDLSSVMYVDEVTIDTSEAVYWTDTNNVSGFDVVVGTTHYRYVEGHVVGNQLHLYAPYMNIVDDINATNKEG